MPFQQRERRSWETYVDPMIRDKSFRLRFGMALEDVLYLVGKLYRPALERDDAMGSQRNGAVSVKFQVAMCLRWLAGGSVYELMDGHKIGKSTAHAIGRLLRGVMS